MASVSELVLNLVIIPVATGIGVGTLLTVLVAYLKGRLKPKTLKIKIGPSEEEAKQKIIQEALSSQGNDSKSAFIILAIDIERRIRELATSITGSAEPKPLPAIINLLVERRLLNDQWRSSFKRVWEIRNRVVHGLDANDNDMELGMELATSLRLELNKVKQETVPEVGGSVFEIYKDMAGKFRWRFKAPNGEILAVGEAYETKKSCINSIRALERNFAGANVIDLVEKHD
jgi:uncharacterized protein YegP (UPF0339 family)